MIARLLKQLKSWYQCLEMNDACESYYEQLESGESIQSYAAPDRWRLISEDLENWQAYAECVYLHGGHDYESHSFIGPDSGSEHHCCRRCHHSFEVTWY